MCSTAGCSLLVILSSHGAVKVGYCDQGNSMYLCGLFLLLIGVAAFKLPRGKSGGSERRSNRRRRRTRPLSYVRSIGSGRYIKSFYLGKQANGRKTESWRYPRWAQPTWARLACQAHPGVLCPPGMSSSLFLIFPIFNILQNWQKDIFWIFRSPFTYRITYLLFFNDSGVFQKVSFMCSSGVMVWIILLSTLMVLPEM